ncbi:MAG: hypothetical protein M3157_07550 [Actinomycetota bacterium]|nr:hypothetical protein [Actinomycetota bacterium]
MAQAQLVPSTPISAKKTYASPMSYVGSFRRVTAWIRSFGDTPPKAVAAWALGIAAITIMWAFVTAWYVVTVFIFGFFMIPFRLIRRGHRKQVHLQEQQLATMQAMMINQQQALARNDANAR